MLEGGGGRIAGAQHQYSRASIVKTGAQGTSPRNLLANFPAPGPGILVCRRLVQNIVKISITFFSRQTAGVFFLHSVSSNCDCHLRNFPVVWDDCGADKVEKDQELQVPKSPHVCKVRNVCSALLARSLTVACPGSPTKLVPGGAGPRLSCLLLTDWRKVVKWKGGTVGRKYLEHWTPLHHHHSHLSTHPVTPPLVLVSGIWVLLVLC